jgi:hypothetical protein
MDLELHDIAVLEIVIEDQVRTVSAEDHMAPW